jgi:Flp pilus assembly protein TadG
MRQLRQFLRSDDGNMSIEFFFVFPMVFMIFTASLESSLFMIRHIMLERSVDVVVRAIRLGQLDGVTHDQLKNAICNISVMAQTVSECKSRMKIWMEPISAVNFDMLAPPRFCVDTSQPIQVDAEGNPIPDPGSIEFGGDNQIMLMRVCYSERPMFPTTAVSVQMPLQADGTYAMISTAVFVNEPG